MDNHRYRERILRLETFFNIPTWLDLKEEIDTIFANADNQLHTKGCMSRDFFAGKCEGINEILQIRNIVLEEADKK